MDRYHGDGGRGELDPVRLAATITHMDGDPQRRAWVLGLRRALPEATVTKDVRRELWATTRHGWLTVLRDRRATHGLVLVDDMEPCPRFRELLLDAVEARPDGPVVIFTMREKAMTAAREKGLSWIRGRTGCWGGSVVLPRAMADDFLAWERVNIDPGYPWDDTRINLYCLTFGVPIFITAPSLMQHVGDDRSTLGNPRTIGGRRRQSVWVADGSPVNWATGYVTDANAFSYTKEMARAGRRR